MLQRTRAAHLLLRWSLAILLAALMVYLGSLLTVATAGYSFALFFLATLLMLAGVSVVVGAGVASSRVVNRSQQVVLIWSSGSLALLLAAVVILLEAYGLFATPACRSGCTGSIAYAGLSLLLIAVLGGASVLAGLGAGITGVVSAATLGKPGWCVALLAYLIGSVLSVIIGNLLVGQGLLSVNSPVVMLFVSPLLTPVVTLIYSLSGREQRRYL